MIGDVIGDVIGEAKVVILPVPADPEAAVRHLARVLGLGFHPDTRGCEYSPPLGEADAEALDAALDRAFAAIGEKVYDVALDEVSKLLDGGGL